MNQTETLIISDARIIVGDQEISNGWLAAANGKIIEIGEGRAPERGLSLGGDLLIPGLVELHTDHLEIHAEPRPRVDWHLASAVVAYDAQVAAAGITTVFDCLRIGSDRENNDKGGQRAIKIAGIINAQAECGNLRAEHHTHLRCEVCTPDVVNAACAVLEKYPVGIMSLMDHTPGQRQFRDISKLRAYYQGKLQMSEEELQAFFNERYSMQETYAVSHREKLVNLAKSHNIALASHDDTTVEHVVESAEAGTLIAEFPTTLEAARASHEKGISVMMGAPNLVRGGSHSGNVAASELARLGVLDIFSSDYIPASLIMAAFELPEHAPNIDLPKAIAMVTSTPARTVGLSDRGEIAVGKRADLVHVRLAETPIVRTVWREGCRVL
ncbi:MAG: alpha-D-ribose 1-methylphosphonate 5-triphosphate diphosphatase [Pseudomonadota bacterium]